MTWDGRPASEYPALDVHGTLPWSVLRADSAAWQARKRWWRAQGVDAVASRADAAGMIATGRHAGISGGVSMFDPHLAETLYSWFCPPGGAVIDPTAGGPVRGIVAAHLGLRYHGIDLSAAQVAANRAVLESWPEPSPHPPQWTVGDAAAVLAAYPADSYDYAMTCPPYHNRERYSDDPVDLSTMTWTAFLAAHAEIIRHTVRVLRQDRFATWVISDVRDHCGHLRRLPALTAEAFLAAGAYLCNEQILVTPVGTHHKTMRPPWTAARTTTRVHQIVLTFVKGDRRKATAAIRGAAAC